MKKTTFDVLRDGKEGPLLFACMQRPDDREARLRYLQFLQATGDPRAEPLRLQVQLSTLTESGSPQTAQIEETRRQLRKLVPTLDRVWWAALARSPETFHCGQARSAPSLHVRFRFECPQNWDLLTETGDPSQRFCTVCAQTVHFADTVSKAEHLARQGACIAVPSAIVDKTVRKVTELAVGRPDWKKMWADRIFGPISDD